MPIKIHMLNLWQQGALSNNVLLQGQIPKSIQLVQTQRDGQNKNDEEHSDELCHDANKSFDYSGYDFAQNYIVHIHRASIHHNAAEAEKSRY